LVRTTGQHWALALPEARYGVPSQELRSWAEQQPTAASAWSTCARGEWLLWALSHAGADLPTLAGVTCEIVREVLPFVPRSERWPPRVLEFVTLLASQGGASGRLSGRLLQKACRGTDLAVNTARKQVDRCTPGGQPYCQEQAVYHALNAISNLGGLLSRWQPRATPHLTSFHAEGWLSRAAESTTLSLSYHQTAQQTHYADPFPLARRRQAQESSRFAQQLREVRWPLPITRPPLQCRPVLQVLWDFVSERTGAGPFTTLQLLEAHFDAPSLLEGLASPSELERKLVAAITFRVGTDGALWREVQQMASVPA
jgi:hypothetical protein